MDPREYLLRYFTDLDKIDIPINVKDNSVGGRLSRFGSRIGTPVKNFINRKASIPNLLTPRSSTITSPWGGSITSSPVVNTLGGEVVDVASSTPKSFFSKVRGLPSGVINRFAGNSKIQNLLSTAKAPVTRRFAGPVLGGTLGTTADLADGMNPVQAFGRNIAGTTAGVIAYPFAEVALPMVPGSGVVGYMGADQLGRRGFDQLYGFATEGSKEPQTGGVLGGPLPNVDDYLRNFEEAGAIEREENEWGSSGQPSASDQIDAYEKSKWLEKTRNSPAQRSGAFTDDELWALQQKHRDWKAARGR